MAGGRTCGEAGAYGDRARRGGAPDSAPGGLVDIRLARNLFFGGMGRGWHGRSLCR